MIYIAAWLVCAVCSYLLLKRFLDKITIPHGGSIKAIQELFKDFDRQEIEEKGYTDERWKLVSENTLLSIINTMLLIINLIVWPLVLALLIYCLYTDSTWENLMYENGEERK